MGQSRVVNLNAREAAYTALLKAFREEAYLNETLLQWKESERPSEKDFSLAKELAFGTMRHAIALESIAKQFSTKKKLSLKRKERVLLFLALYQALYLNKIPSYAIANEMGELAKKMTSPHFASFLNALLQKVFKNPPDVSRFSSYPELLVQKLQKELGEKTTGVLKSMNTPSKSHVLLRKKIDIPNCVMKDPFLVMEANDPMKWVENDFSYVMNITPLTLIKELSKQLLTPPKKILDLAASPGGKSIACSTLYPEAELFCNDLTESKKKKLIENFSRLGVDAKIRIGPGETYPTDQKFDLILLDVPCSNSGVLGKKPEAHLRFQQEKLDELKQIQEKLLTHALQLLNPEGQIWYMTCSILQEENEQLIQNVLQKHPALYLHFSALHLPDQTGDGGFGAALRLEKRSSRKAKPPSATKIK